MAVHIFPLIVHFLNFPNIKNNAKKTDNASLFLFAFSIPIVYNYQHILETPNKYDGGK